MDRWNRLHLSKKPRKSYFAKQLEPEPFPIVATPDYMKIVADQLGKWAPAGLTALGTDGYGRSDTREELRRFFEVDAESIGPTYSSPMNVPDMRRWVWGSMKPGMRTRSA